MRILRFFIILACFAASALAAPAWTYGTWSDGSVSSSAANLAVDLGTICTLTGNDGSFVPGVPELLSNGIFEHTTTHKFICGVKKYATVTYSFGESTANISELKIYTYWGDNGRNGFEVQSVEFTVDGVNWTPLADSQSEHIDWGNAGGIYGFLADDGGESLAQDVKGVRINFGWMDNESTGVSEIEVIGELTSLATYTVTFVDMHGNPLAILENVESGSSVADRAPVAPDVEGFTFIGWDTGLSVITGTCTIHPIYQPKGTIGVSATAVDASFNYSVSELDILAFDGVTNCFDFGYTDEYMYNTHPEVVTDGIIHGGGVSELTVFSFGDDARAAFFFPDAQDVDFVSIYSHWGDAGRVGITVDGIDVIYAGESAFTPLVMDSASFNLDGVMGITRMQTKVAMLDGAPLAVGVTALRIRFGAMQNHHAGIEEIVVASVCTPRAEWTFEGYDNTLDRTALDNLLRHGGASVTQVANPQSTIDIAMLYDGMVVPGTPYEIGDNAIFDFVFDASSNISGLDFWTYWSDSGRDGLNIRQIGVKKSRDTYFHAITSIPSCDLLTDTDIAHHEVRTSGRLHFMLRPTEGEFLATNVRQMRVVFGHQDNMFTGYQEFEVFGERAPRGTVFLLQ